MTLAGAIFVDAGEYVVGSDEIPNAGPRHIRRIDSGFWIDREPVSCAEFERFTIGGGFSNLCGSENPQVAPIVDSTTSVDQICHDIRRSSEVAFSSEYNRPLLRKSAVTGLNWFEADAICKRFNARLPFEVEWEIAMHLIRGGDDSFFPKLEEWTIDAFSPQFWRADFGRRGIPWFRDAPLVTVRGFGPSDLFKHLASRRGKPPSNRGDYCGFRRVWENVPPAQAFDFNYNTSNTRSS